MPTEQATTAGRTPATSTARDEPLARDAAVRPSRRALLVAVAAAAVAMTTSAVWVGLAGDHFERPVAVALYRGYLVAAFSAVGLVWCVRRPHSRFGALLVAFGFLAWIWSWQSSDVPLLFDLGVLVELPLTFLTFYLFLAFPTGRLHSAAERALLAVLGLVLLAFFLPWPFLSPSLAGGGPLSRCVPGCPDNVFQLGSAPRLLEVLGDVEVYGALAVTIGVLLVYGRRVSTATRAQRRALLAVAVTSLLFLPLFFAFHFARVVLEVGPSALDPLAWALVAIRVLLPLGFLVALLQAEFFGGAVTRTLLELLATRPTVESWRRGISAALDDPHLRLGYFDAGRERFSEADGTELRPPRPGSGSMWVPVVRDDAPVAAMVVDDALGEDPELVDAAVRTTLLAVENGHLEGELRASRTRIVQAAHAERRRIERDLHDSAQQRLVALRIHLALASERVAASEGALLEELGDEVDEAIDELRTVAHGVYPETLADHGIAAALSSITRRALPFSVRDDGIGRHAEATELTVYFCCLEALQNAAKHAGPGASANIHLREDARALHFTVSDDGAGFDPSTVEHGTGLTGLADRLAAAGGTLEVDAAPGLGARITGHVPV